MNTIRYADDEVSAWAARANDLYEKRGLAYLGFGILLAGLGYFIYDNVKERRKEKKREEEINEYNEIRKG